MAHDRIIFDRPPAEADPTARSQPPGLAPAAARSTTVGRVNPTVFLISLGAVLVGAALLFVYFGLADLPVGRSPQQAAGYFGVRLIPFGLTLMIVGFAATLAIVIGEALVPLADGPVKARATIGLSTLAELLRAVTGLSATPAGIGALITLLGAFLLVGSGAAASTIP
ncbi:MAG: hypothetical protein ACRDGQ_09385 [Candidatus Limnocylindrales bacterium]